LREAIEAPRALAIKVVTGDEIIDLGRVVAAEGGRIEPRQ
jgi:hypothetical protein